MYNHYTMEIDILESIDPAVQADKNKKPKKTKSIVVVKPDGRDNYVDGGLLLDRFLFNKKYYYKDLYNCIWDSDMNIVGIIKVDLNNKLQPYIYHFIRNPYSEGLISVCSMNELVEMGLFKKIQNNQGVFYQDKNNNLWDMYGVSYIPQNCAPKEES